MAKPAESKSDEASQYKIEDLYDINKEKELLKTFVDVALAPQDKTWSKHKTKNKALQVDYKYLPNDNLCTIRGQTMIPNASIEQYHEFSEGGYNDVYQWEKECDKMCTENGCVKAIDIDHEVVYGSYDSGVFVISPRDFCYLKARYLLKDYKASDGKLYDVSCTLCYSVDDKYPFYRSTKKKHVRAILKYSGYLFIKDKSDTSTTDSCRACYIVYLDPCGWIPTWVVNLVAPDQGMVIKSMLENWPKVQPLLDARKANEYKKDVQPMFDKPQQFPGFDDTDNDDNKEEVKDDSDKGKVGGFKDGEKSELEEAANAVKSDIESAAKEKGIDMKCFEVINGDKQVVAGMNYNIKIKYDDDKYVNVKVFRSLPPVKYELKSVDFGDGDDKNKESDSKENDDDDDKLGGWKQADSQEIFDVANATKEQVEEQAKKDGKDEFKIFEPVSGTKQVVAGINYKIKVKVGDDRFIEVLVFQSLPPIKYELKSVTY
mmetsp:Transcript_1889/g.1597  ORF Transcript_1889/g.1597 Transcript_1889/m.1597 type:complete len:487 (+) Transcript_1889:29-1489(+)|eukprot:CAMPEP_0201572274 /NCGR_PEP_ID=MMETSP0190_2-20130828/15430_1 /ASSEMBLY_ACC=CAM_ASM_000263 /TAXON_ID=37353 /ORGANISM="Rosalina sp." /LENGTH=486 /DNA_ID=CAMNT_0047997809 /DNA_START=28 /DNA_END=1488 /DNA_ORIENTATION=-